MEPIVIIEDDHDDQEIIKTTLESLDVKNRLVFFDKAETALEYLTAATHPPFIIFSDINMPGMTGLELRNIIQEDPLLSSKCIPFIFLTTGRECGLIWEAYSKNAQGFFTKPNSLHKWKCLFEMIINYWDNSKKPQYH